jgi:hypothetical protein
MTSKSHCASGAAHTMSVFADARYDSEIAQQGVGQLPTRKLTMLEKQVNKNLEGMGYGR